MPTKPDAGCVGITCPIGGGGIGAGGGTTGGGTTGGGTTGGGGGGTTGGGTTGGGTTGGGTTGGGTTGGGTTGGGTGGGTTGGGTGGGGMPSTIAAARAATFPAEVNLTGLVVTAISFAGVSMSTGADCTGTTVKGVNASFWVADPANPQQGIWVSKFRCDGAIDADPMYFPVPGDVVDIRGIVGFDSQFNDRTAFRVVVQSEFNYLPSSMRPAMCETGSSPACRPLLITRTGNMVPPPPINVPQNFGMAGALKAEPAYAGARIKIMGTVAAGDIYPMALKRISAVPNDDRYYGWQTDTGVLVNDFRTFNNARLEDGGQSRCDVRFVILDGGMLSFPNGIVGVWDSYAHASCQDGGTDSQCFKNRALVPGMIDAGLAYTNVLYPTDCADLMP
ncbi:MAG: hypothetical protein JNM17_14850 [Archangium sp.]|nr:hypothetical protein [Archangium sp.]